MGQDGEWVRMGSGSGWVEGQGEEGVRMGTGRGDRRRGQDVERGEGQGEEGVRMGKG